MNYFRAPVLLSLFLVFASVVQAISSVIRYGRYLYTDDGARFSIKGAAYQPQGAVAAVADNPFDQPTGFVDPLADSSGCQRDLPYLMQLGVNVIRVYSVNSSLNHDSCMDGFSKSGIYVIVDLSTPLNGSINSAVPTWDTDLLNQYTDSIDAFSKYDNVLAYTVGNEVVISQENTYALPYVKAAARDTKAYLLSKGYSPLTLYAAIDGAAVEAVAEYLSCDYSGTNSSSTSIDIFGLNDYEWCGNSTFEASYAATVTLLAALNIVTIFSEFGCIVGVNGPRPWTEVVAIFGTLMITWSGGIAFSYFPATSSQGQFGMVNISQDGSTVTVSQDFLNLAAQYKNAVENSSPSISDATPPSYPSCPANSSSFLASPILPPTPNDAACNCVEENLPCQFTPQTNNYSSVAGSLFDEACSLIGSNGGTCDDISSNGTTGVYPLLSGCGTITLLSYAFSLYQRLTDNNAASCNFAGNATSNPGVSATVSVSAVESSCFAGYSTIFTPSASSTSGSSPKSTSKTGSGSVSLVGNIDAIFGMSVMAIIAVMSAVWTLA